jgi:predicted dienelactone hydrolase
MRARWSKTAAALIGGLVLAGSCAPGSDDTGDWEPPPFSPSSTPDAPGPYLAGNRSVFLEDPDRPLGCGEGNRVLLTELWYPAADHADDLPEDTIRGFFLGRWDEVVAAIEGDPDAMLDLPTGSYRDAPVHPDAWNLPVVLFSHGFTSNRFQNYTLAAFLAGHGYVVVAPDHICNAHVTLTEDAVVPGTDTNPYSALDARLADLPFLLDQLRDSPPAPLAGRLDSEQVALSGHSWGAVSVTELLKTDDRARALVQITGFGFPPAAEEVEVGTLSLWGQEDGIMGPFVDWHDEVLEQLPPPVYELEFMDTGHFAFSDLCRFVPDLAEEDGCGTGERLETGEVFTNLDPDEVHEVASAYAAAFLGATLYDVPELHTYLADNHFPERVEYTTELP